MSLSHGNLSPLSLAVLITDEGNSIGDDERKALMNSLIALVGEAEAKELIKKHAPPGPNWIRNTAQLRSIMQKYNIPRNWHAITKLAASVQGESFDNANGNESETHVVLIDTETGDPVGRINLCNLLTWASSP